MKKQLLLFVKASALSIIFLACTDDSEFVTDENSILDASNKAMIDAEIISSAGEGTGTQDAGGGTGGKVAGSGTGIQDAGGGTGETNSAGEGTGTEDAGGGTRETNSAGEGTGTQDAGGGTGETN